MLLALALLIVALARPRGGTVHRLTRRDGIDIVLALDLSGSMTLYDLPRGCTDGEAIRRYLSGNPPDRLAAAKKAVKDFILRRPDDRIGLIGFADAAYRLSPPTLDHGWLLARLEQLAAGTVGERTGLASPIGEAAWMLKGSDAKRRVAVLFTDGFNTVGNRVTPEEAAKQAAEEKVILYTVGIGSGNAAAVERGGIMPVRDNFDAPLLEKLANTGKGRYFHASDPAGLIEVMRQIDRLEKTRRESPTFTEYDEYAPRIGLAALLLMLAGFIWDHAVRPTLP